MVGGWKLAGLWGSLEESFAHGVVVGGVLSRIGQIAEWRLFKIYF